MGSLPVWVEWFFVVFPGAVALVIAAWGFWKWNYRPKFIVGVPPPITEQKDKNILQKDLGRKTIISEFQHSDKCLAKRLTKNKPYLSEKDIRNLYLPSMGNRFNFRCRDVILDTKRKGSLAVIVENSGKRVANDYILGIQFLQPDVHILNVKVESLAINTFYSLHPELVQDQLLKNKMTDERIVNAYSNYLHPLLDEQFGDMIFLMGALEGGTYEMVLIELSVEENIDRFQIRFFVDCSDSWISQQTFFQGFIIKD
jgi:hypothetical protein